MDIQPGCSRPGSGLYWCALPVLALLLMIGITASAGNGNKPGVSNRIENPEPLSEKNPAIPNSVLLHGESSTPHPTISASAYPSEQSLTLRQKRNLRREHFAGLSVNFLGPTLGYGSVSMNYSIGTVTQIEAGIDLSTVYGGINLYPLRLDRGDNFSPYMGLMVAYGRKISSDKKDDIYMYMPVGIRYLNDDNWFFSVEVAATTADHVSSSPFYTGIRLGYRFWQ